MPYWFTLCLSRGADLYHSSKQCFLTRGLSPAYSLSHPSRKLEANAVIKLIWIHFGSAQILLAVHRAPSQKWGLVSATAVKTNLFFFHSFSQNHRTFFLKALSLFSCTAVTPRERAKLHSMLIGPTSLTLQYSCLCALHALPRDILSPCEWRLFICGYSCALTTLFVRPTFCQQSALPGVMHRPAHPDFFLSRYPRAEIFIRVQLLSLRFIRGSCNTIKNSVRLLAASLHSNLDNKPRLKCQYLSSSH